MIRQLNHLIPICITFIAAIFLSKESLQIRTKDIFWMPQDTLSAVKSLARQKANTPIGSVLLFVSFIWQMINLRNPLDFSNDLCRIPLKTIFVAIALGILFFIVCHYLSKNLISRIYKKAVSDIHMSNGEFSMGENREYVVYCADCDKDLELDKNFPKISKEYIGWPIKCCEDPSHLAQVVYAMNGRFWLRRNLWLKKWETKVTPRMWPGIRSLLKGRAIWYVFLRFLLLLGFLHVAQKDYIWVCLPAIFFLADILLTNSSIAFVTKSPAQPFRTIIASVLSYVSIAAAFGILYVVFNLTW